MKRLAAIVLAASIAATVGIVGMSPANASTAHSVTITLTPGTPIGSDGGCNETTTFSTSTTVIYAQPGDTISVTWTGFVISGTNYCAFGIASTAGGNMTGWSYFAGSTVELGGTSVIGFNILTGSRLFTVGTVETQFDVNDGGLGIRYGIIFRVLLSNPGDTPPDFLQQFAIAADDSCDSVPEAIDVFAVPRAGGWSKSWAQWPNGGSGGFICTRTVGYQPSIQGWLPRE